MRKVVSPYVQIASQLHRNVKEEERKEEKTVQFKIFFEFTQLDFNTPKKFTH